MGWGDLGVLGGLDKFFKGRRAGQTANAEGAKDAKVRKGILEIAPLKV
jgi:hypothetical protein